MPKIRILVVDDSVVVRRMVSDVLATDPQLKSPELPLTGRLPSRRFPSSIRISSFLTWKCRNWMGSVHWWRSGKCCRPCRNHVQHPYRAGRGGHPRGAFQGCYGLCHQALQRRKCCTGVGMHSDATDSEGQSDLWPGLGVPPSSSLWPQPLPPRRPRRAWHCLVAKSESTLSLSVCPQADLTPLPVSFRPSRATSQSPWSSFNTCLPVFTRLLAERLAAKSQIGVEEGFRERS